VSLVTMSEPKSQATKRNIWRTRLHRAAAGLTHALFASVILLAFVRADAPQAGGNARDVTGALGDGEKTVERLTPKDAPAGSQEPEKSVAPDAGAPTQAEPEERQLAAADPQPRQPLPPSQTEVTAPAPSENATEAESGEIVVAQRRRKRQVEEDDDDDDDEEAAKPAPARVATEEEKARHKPLLDRLVAAYPDFLSGHEGGELIWKDGTRMVFDDGKEKSFDEKLADADLEDQFAIAYAPGPMLDDPAADSDPGRIRNEAFFRKMYGNCRKGEVDKKLEQVTWLPEHGGKKIKVTSANGVAQKLQQVSDELDKLPDDLLKYLQPVASTYNCRDISRTSRSSAHGYGIAVDIAAKYGDYWQWGRPKRGGVYTYRNRVPWEIAEIFERHGFIWGGKWYHFDTLHFEYRPELLAAGGTDAPQQGTGDVPMPDKQPRNLN
jgi:hypothetical protein